MMSKFITIVVFTIIFYSVSINAQKPVVVKGGKLCEDYLLKRIIKEKALDSRIVKLKSFDTNDKTLSPELEKWFEGIHQDLRIIRISE